MHNRIILPLSTVGIDDIARVGGKSASPGEMLHHPETKQLRTASMRAANTAPPPPCEAASLF